MKFALDEHIAAAVADGLRRRNIDALTVAEVGRRGIPDHDQLRWAMETERVWVTFDDDFLRLAAAGVEHHGIAYCHAQKHDVGSLIAALAAVVDDDLQAGGVAYI